jgi:glycosyltransferase involved in cell wall biosynthesis
MAGEILTQGLQTEFWVVGTDLARSGYDETLKDMARTMELGSAVRFTGFRADIPSVMSELDLVVSASHYESFGRTLVEAMAAARPVVATAVGGVPEIIDDGVTGLLVPPHDPSALASGVARLLSDPALRARMGRAGREHASRHFGVDVCAERVLSVYSEVVLPEASPRSLVR